MGTTTAKTSGKELTISRLLHAPRELVFDAWTDPKHVVHWWGPNGFTLTNHEMDVKAAGVWRFIMHGPDGRDYPNKIIFIEVVKPERLVYKHAGENDTEPVSFHVMVTFEKKGNKTMLTMKSVFESSAELEKVNREYGAIEGGKQTVERLDEYLSKMQGNNNPFVIERTLNAPVAKVWKAITDKDEMKQWYFDLSEFKPEVDFEFQFPGEGTKGEKYIHLCKITEVIAGKKIAYSWRYDGYNGNSLVTFELFEEGDKTRLQLTHEGLETFPTSNADFAKESFAEGWTHIIGTSLKKFTETPVYEK